MSVLCAIGLRRPTGGIAVSAAEETHDFILKTRVGMGHCRAEERRLNDRVTGICAFLIAGITSDVCME